MYVGIAEWKKEGRDVHTKQASIQPPTRTFFYKMCIIESVDSVCRDSMDTQYMYMLI